MIERAEELERSLDEQLPWALSPSFVHGMFLFALDRIDEARRQFEEEYEQAVAVGDWFRSIYLAWLAEVELRSRELGEGTRAHARNEGARPGGLDDRGRVGSRLERGGPKRIWGTRGRRSSRRACFAPCARRRIPSLSRPQRVRPRASAALSGT